MFTIFGRSISCLVTPKLVGLVRDTSANNINLISSTRENTYILSVNRGILVRTMADSSNEIRPKSQNRLALEKSPYLLQHANNPVDWYPWGEEAFAKARHEDRLLFLSVGYATCHWCHVMEHECFENEAVAALMNRHFVNVKVDREERPDVDRLYMTFVQATSGGGGWPMSVWLTPDLLPVFGGTYFPPEDDISGRPGFKTLLSVIEKQWRENRAKMAASGARVASALSRVASRSAADDEASTATTSGGAGASRRRPAGPEYAEQCFKALEAAFDARHGGFGRAPKFPQAPVLEFLLTEWARAPTQANGKVALQMVSKTLKHLALGGVRDHVGEGFARYSVDGEWRVPHFEKMLYDQAQLSAVYASVYLATKDPLFASACRGAIEYTERALGHPEGGFCSAEDADSVPSYNLNAEPLEGAFYVWTEDEVREALRSPGAEWQMRGEEPLSDLFCRRFCISAEGNVAPALDPHGHLTGRNVLRLNAAPGQDSSGDDAREGERLKHALGLLRVVRDTRPRPRKDHKIITAWNGLMISALSRAGEALGDEALVQRAVKAAAFTRSHLFAEGRLLRVVYAPDTPGTSTPGDIIKGSSPIWGFLSDYTFLIRGLLDLYEASLDPEWLSWAEQLQETQNELFWDEEGLGFFTTTLGDTSILFRSKEDEDGAEPASGGVATLNLLRLGTLTGREEHCARADKCLRAASPLLRAAPHAAPTLCAAARAKDDGALGVVVTRDEAEDAAVDKDASAQALLAIVRSRLLPWRALALADTRLAACEALSPARREQVCQMAQQPGAAFVCRRRACSLPVRDTDALARLLEAHME